MKILKVIHGYPMMYNAGSEVYSQTLAHGLCQRHEVHVFTREENSFAPDYALRLDIDPDEPRIRKHIVNMPRARDRYRHTGVDRRFAQVLDLFEPEVVHIGHLNHLSTSLVTEAATRGLPVVYTLHDYWLMCPRGQFMQMFPEDPTDLWAACDGQDDRSCALRCYSRYFSGSPDEAEQDIAFWTDWVARRMAHVREVVDHIDLFLAPARYLMDRYVRDFGLPRQKVRYLDYGFDRDRFVGRRRAPGEPTTFGYIGTHIPAKGIHHLIEAFGQVQGDALLRIWGRPRGQDTRALEDLAVGKAIEWFPEYENRHILRDVFDRVDAIVVPSVWVENSPLVIHEAQGAGVPVITARAGGMAEYVQHEVNGLLFEHRDPVDLSRQLQRLIDNPQLGRQLGARGYLYDPVGRIPDIGEHVRQVEAIYEEVLARRDSARIEPLVGPWRITFDTNPDDCNLHCIMCEEHSSHSPLQKQRKAEKRPKRRMDPELFRRVIPEAAALGMKEVIPSTMGEPLLYAYFEEIIGLCHEYGLKLNLTTNGTFPKKPAEAWAKLIVPVASDTKISINGATAGTQEFIMEGSHWDTLLDNVRAFIKVRDEHAASGGNRCRVTFQVTFLQSNVQELAQIVKLAADLGVDRVKGHHLWTHFDEVAQESMRRDPQAIAQWNEVVRAAEAAAEQHRLPWGAKVLLDNIFELEPDATTDLAPGGPCPFLGQEAWVSAEGRFDPCCAPDAQRRSLGEFGNLANMGLPEIWTGERYQRLVASYRSRALCQGCNMRRPVEA